MRDERGLYYLAQPGNLDVRVYVRKGPDGEVEFRLWNRQYPEVWENHPWLSMKIIADAAALYREERNADANPLKLYDLNVAKSLLAGEKA